MKQTPEFTKILTHILSRRITDRSRVQHARKILSKRGQIQALTCLSTAFDFQPPFIETSATRDSVEQSSQDHVVSQPPADQPQPEVEGDSEEQQTSMKTTPVMLDGQQRTRSGRVVRKPCRYQDYGT